MAVTPLQMPRGVWGRVLSSSQNLEYHTGHSTIGMIYQDKWTWSKLKKVKKIKKIHLNCSKQNPSFKIQNVSVSIWCLSHNSNIWSLFTILKNERLIFYRDIAPEGATLAETNKNLDEIVDLAIELQNKTGVKLLWATCNLFAHQR